MIVEGIVTTLGPDEALNVAPMGPTVEGGWSTFRLRPFRSSTTYRNLSRSGAGVFHVTDDVQLIARAALGPVDDVETRPAEAICGRILLTASRYYEFRATEIDPGEDRPTFLATTIASGRLRDLVGLNRAKHAVVEAAILATRLDFLPIERVREDLERLRPLVEKTGDAPEREAFALLDRAVAAREAIR